MKHLFVMSLLVLFTVVFLTAGIAGDKAANKYVGQKACAPCHKSDKIGGNQYDVWHSSKHAQAYTALTTPAADSIAKAGGSKTAAAKTAACLECHALTADAADPKDGVQCETCHGAGSAYKTMAIMKDKVKAAAAGAITYADNKAIEAKCVQCHNDKSPTFKGFKFEEHWAKIKHGPVVKKS